jgi:pimeloyl-ACP methyl ester carboxylesterase
MCFECRLRLRYLSLKNLAVGQAQSLCDGSYFGFRFWQRAQRIPVLIVQGTTDIQASRRDAKALANGNPASKLLLIEGMNHVLKTVPNERDKQISSYSDPT